MKKHKIIFWSVVAGGTILAVYFLTKKKPKTNALPNQTIKVGDTSTKVDGTPIQIVDAAGDYMELSDPTTLYNANGDVIGNLNDYTKQFVSPTGVVLTNAPAIVSESSFIGKTVESKSYNVYVRSSAGVVNDVIYNNIVGVLVMNEQAGIVKGTTKDVDGNVWLNVSRLENYNCPFLVCGLGFSHNNGWVLASDIVVA